jgi:hypothetical protein
MLHLPQKCSEQISYKSPTTQEERTKEDTLLQDVSHSYKDAKNIMNESCIS